MIISSILGFFEGRVVLYADADNREKAVRAVVGSGVPSRIHSDKDKGGVFITLSPANAKKIASAIDKSDIIVYINSVCGFKKLCVSCRKRIGFILGAILFVLTLTLSTLFVFNIEIVGADTVSEHEIKAELAKLGVKEGALISGIDRTQTAAKLLQMHPEYAWAALNLNGTTVVLELKEHKDESAPVRENADILVASADGVIKQILVYSGKPAVKIGSSVKKGDILICGYISGSGLQYTQEPLLRFDGARGSVRAEVAEEFCITVPYTETLVEYTDEKRIGVIISFLGHSAAFGKTPKSETDECYYGDQRRVRIFGDVEIPITVKECFKRKRQNTTVQTDAASAKLKAELMAGQELTKRLGEDRLCESDITYSEGDSEITVTVRYLCIREIAEPKAIG